ncbi:MAG: PAS domain S-box protein [Candidatus Edwardsbacteria bacterium]|nr:PAS domain S-box protein [Candidatus Edwardsbacteria bacterium]
MTHLNRKRRAMAAVTLALIVVTLLLVVAVIWRGNLFDRFDAWFVSHEAKHIVQILVIFLVLAMAAVVYAVRRSSVLKKSEIKYHDLFDNAGDAILIADTETAIILDANKAAEILLGKSRREIIGINRSELHPADKAAQHHEEFKQHVGAGLVTDAESEVIRKDGTVVPVRISAKVINLAGRKVIQGIFRDITKCKQAETDLKQNYDTQSALSALLQLAHEDISIEESLNHSIDLILSIPWLSLESQGGIFLVEDDPEVMVMKAQRNLAHPIQQACARVPFGRCLCGRAAMTKKIQFADCLDEHHGITYNGIIPHGHYCIPIISAGMTLGVINLYVREGHRRSKMEEMFLTSMADALAGILQRKRMEAELRKFHTAVEQCASIIVITDLEANIQYVNQAFASVTGYSREEAIGKNPRMLKSGWTTEEGYQRMWQVLTTGGTWKGEFHNKKNGELYWEQAIITSIRDEQGKPAFYMAIKEDITMRRALEEERERLLAKLQDSLDNIKTLKGLIPICSSCKKIRNDQGYWQQVEVYVADHTGADFSHGLCDECAHKLYAAYFHGEKSQRS